MGATISSLVFVHTHEFEASPFTVLGSDWQPGDSSEALQELTNRVEERYTATIPPPLGLSSWRQVVGTTDLGKAVVAYFADLESKGHVLHDYYGLFLVEFDMVGDTVRFHWVAAYSYQPAAIPEETYDSTQADTTSATTGTSQGSGTSTGGTPTDPDGDLPDSAGGGSDTSGGWGYFDQVGGRWTRSEERMDWDTGNAGDDLDPSFFEEEEDDDDSSNPEGAGIVDWTEWRMPILSSRDAADVARWFGVVQVRVRWW